MLSVTKNVIYSNINKSCLWARVILTCTLSSFVKALKWFDERDTICFLWHQNRIIKPTQTVHCRRVHKILKRGC